MYRNPEHLKRLNTKEKLIKKSYKGFSLINLIGLKIIYKIYKIFEILFFGRFDSYLNNLNGVIHIGAYDGIERDVYKKYKVKKVVWIEPNPFAFEDLKKNIISYDNQKAYNYLITDTNNIKYNFKITSGDIGQHSTISQHEELIDMYPDMKIDKEITLEGYTLTEFLKKEKININEYSTLILDVEGAELKVLKGLGNQIENFKFIRVETSEFNLYKDYPLIYDISSYMKKFNFKEIRRIETDQNDYYQKCFDVLYGK